MTETLTRRIEVVIDRWNQLPRQWRGRLTNDVTKASMGLAALVKQHKELLEAVANLERAVENAEHDSVDVVSSSGPDR